MGKDTKPYVFTDVREGFHDRTVNTVATGQQRRPDVAVDIDSNSITVWEDGDKNVQNILARGLNDIGRARISDFTVNGTPGGDLRHPVVACDDEGNFVVVWEERREGVFGIRARGFDASGNETLAEFAVCEGSAGPWQWPAIAMSRTGAFVITWRHDVAELGAKSMPQVFARAYDAAGAQSVAQLHVNSNSAGVHGSPDVAMDDSGNFTIAWVRGLGEGRRIWVRGFNGKGAERFPERTVGASDSGAQGSPAIGMSPDGRFAITWEVGTVAQAEIHVAGFSSMGAETFPEELVHVANAGQRLDPDIACDDAARFAVIWSEVKEELSQIKARGFHANGTERFPQSTVNTTTSGQQLAGAMAMSRHGRFVVTWQDDADGNGYYQIVARGLIANGQ
jgi:hypothetical protein